MLIAFNVTWGDGTENEIEAYSQGEATHVYQSINGSQTFTVNITGLINGISFEINGASKDKLRNIVQWGDLLLGNSGGYFSGCSNLDISAQDIPHFNNTFHMDSMFYGASSLLYDGAYVNSWDVSFTHHTIISITAGNAYL